MSDDPNLESSAEPTEEPTLPPSPKSPCHSDTDASISEEAATIAPGQPVQSAADHIAPASPGEAATLAAKPQPTGLPRQFGDYELIEEIARGGMGIVFKARQQRLNRLVAIKMILTGQLAGSEDVQRFYAEAEAAANLDHIGIVPIYEVGEIDGQHFFSMGFIEGPSLASVVAERPMEARQAAEVTKLTAEAIAYAHSKGVIHRDLKPANVLLATGESLSSMQAPSIGTPKVTDFGLAKQAESQSELTATGQILGTPGYMPPEQAAGKLDEVGPLSDVYSIGGILYALLTGRAPFQAATPIDTLVQVLEREPVPPRQLNASVPRDLETICLKCLQKDANRRYDCAEELAADLERFLDESPIEARPVTTTERVWRWARKHPAIASLAITTGLLLLTILIGAPLVALQQAKLRNAESVAKIQAVEANEDLEAAKNEAEAAHYAANISLAYSQWSRGALQRARQLLNETPIAYRNWEWWYLDQLCAGKALPLRGNQGYTPTIRFDQDGKLLTATKLAKAQLFDLESGLPSGTRELASIEGSFNRDATQVITKIEDQAYVYTLPQTRILHSFKTVDQPVVAVTQSLDSPLVAFLRKSDSSSAGRREDDWTLELADPIKGEILQKFDRLPRSTAPQLCLSPNGQSLAYLVDSQRVLLWQAATGWSQNLIRPSNYIVSRVAFSPATDATQGEELLALAGGDGLVRVYRPTPEKDQQPNQSSLSALPKQDIHLVSTGPESSSSSSSAIAGFQQLAVLLTSGSEITAIKWDKSGEWLAAGGADRIVNLWHSLAPETKSEFRGVEEEIIDLAFDASASRIAAATKFGIRVWGIEDFDNSTSYGQRQDCATLGITSSPLRRLAMSSNERTCIVVDETLKIFRINTNTWQVELLPTQNWLQNRLDGAAIEPPEYSAGLGSEIEISPDGRLLAFSIARVIESNNIKQPLKTRSSVVLWDLVANRPIRLLGEHNNLITSIVFSPDGKSLMVATGLDDEAREEVLKLSRLNVRFESGKNEVRIWNVESGQVRSTLMQQDEPITAICLSPDGERLAVAGKNAGMRIFNWSSGEELESISSPAAIYPSQLCWINANDKEQIIAASLDGRIRVYDAASGDLKRMLEGHAGTANCVQSFRENKRLLTGADDSTLRIWDPEAGLELLSLPHGGRAISDATIFKDEILSVCRDGKLRRWTADVQSDVSSASWKDATRDTQETPGVWKGYLGEWDFSSSNFTAKTQVVSQVPGVGQLAAARASLPGIKVPDVSELTFSVQFSGGTGLQVFYEHLSRFDGEMVEILSESNPFTQRKGVTISSRAGPTDFREATSNPTFELGSEEAHQVRIVRTSDALSVFIDGKLAIRNRRATSIDCELVLQPIYGQPGSTVTISDVVLKSPQESIQRRAVTAKLQQWLEEELIIDRVLKRIEDEAAWSYELKRFARSRASGLVEKSTPLRDKVTDMLKDDSLPPQQRQRLGEFADRLVQLIPSPSNWLRAAGAQFELGNYEEAYKSLRESFRLGQSRTGEMPAEAWATLASTQKKLGKLEEAKTNLAKANRSILLEDRSAETVERIRAQLQQNFGEEATFDGLDDEQRKLLDLVLGRSQEANDDASMLSRDELYAPDFELVRTRGFETQQTTTISREKWLAVGEILGGSGLVGLEDLEIEDADIRIQGDRGAVRFEAYVESEFDNFFGLESWQRVQVTVSLRKTDGAWRVSRQVEVPQSRTAFYKIRRLDSSLFAKIDKEVDQLSTDASRSPGVHRERVLKLLRSLRMEEAYEDAVTLTERPEAIASDWILRSRIALALGLPDDAQLAANKALEIDRSVDGPNWIRALADNMSAGGVEREEVSDDLTAEVPVNWQRKSSEAFLAGGGDIQAGWMVEPPQAVIIIRIKLAGMTPEAFMPQIKQANASLKRKIVSEERLEIAGQTVVRIDMEGPGNGGMIDGRGPILTYQSTAVFFRADDLMLFTAVSPAEDWEELQVPYTQMLKSVQKKE